MAKDFRTSWSSEHEILKPKMDQGFYTRANYESSKMEHATSIPGPDTCIIVGHQLKMYKMMMNWFRLVTCQYIRKPFRTMKKRLSKQ